MSFFTEKFFFFSQTYNDALHYCRVHSEYRGDSSMCPCLAGKRALCVAYQQNRKIQDIRPVPKSIHSDPENNNKMAAGQVAAESSFLQQYDRAWVS